MPFNTKQNKSICILPWIHKYRSVGGHESPCCIAENFQNETMQDIRTQMLSDKKPKVCDICYKSESNGGWSRRLEETTKWISKHGAPDIDKPKIQYLDIRFDPTCNMKCKTCNPGSSTLWQKEKGVHYPVNQDSYEEFSKIDKTNLKQVYLAGGEPTFIKKYLDFLNDLYECNPECEVVINSNLKSLSNEWKNVFVKFKNLSLICSCDATDQLGTYIRYPLNWETFEKNVQFAVKNVNHFEFNMVCSNLNTHKIFETCNWMSKYTKNIGLEILSKPEIFSAKSVPKNFRQVYIESIQKLLKFPVSIHKYAKFRNNINYLIKLYSQDNYDSNLHANLFEEIKEQDSHRNLKLKDVDSFLYNWIK